MVGNGVEGWRVGATERLSCGSAASREGGCHMHSGFFLARQMLALSTEIRVEIRD